MSYDATIKILEDDGDLIIYRKSLRKIAGSVTGTILLQQIIFRSKGRENFYKFKSPCSHELYKERDSWTEELGFSPKEFDNALKKIGTKITRGTSKFDALKKDDPASIVIYWTDANRVTWYQLNRNLLGKLLKGIYLEDNKEGLTLKIPKEDLPLSETPPETTPEKESAKINFALPPCPHSSLSGEVVFFQDGDTLHRAIVTRVMGKTLNLTLTESGSKKRYVRPAGAVFYQNGSAGLSPVEVGAGETEKKMSDGETTIFNAIIDLMPEPGFIAEAPYKRGKRMKEIIESARKAHASGIKAVEFEAFGAWYLDVSWAGRDSPPPITLETIRKNWSSFQSYRGGTNGQVGRRNQTGQSGTGSQARGVTSDQTAAYIEQNRDNFDRKIERLTR